jgi:glutathione S-transferase
MKAHNRRYELFYWPEIQGRGEFVRLALEQAGADYVDVARTAKRGVNEMIALMNDPKRQSQPFAPPFLRAGKVVIGQTANILLFLGPRLKLSPRDEAKSLWVHQLQLTIADWVGETHDTHHPIGGGLYYEEQKRAAKRRAAEFTAERLPKFFPYFEAILKRNAGSGPYLLGRTLTYADLSLFQMVAGLRYAFPKTMARLEPKYPHTVQLHNRIAALPRIKAYLASSRRLPFNQEGIFRHYKELDK